MKPIYEWVWKRAKGKTFLMLTQNGKKIGSVREDLWQDFCFCYKVKGPGHICYEKPCINDEPRFIAYKGGGLLGKFMNMTAAKIAVEQALGVSTMKEKKKPEPKITPKGIDPETKKQRAWAKILNSNRKDRKKMKNDTRGNTFLEYALMMAFLAVAVVAVCPNIMENVQNVYVKVTGALQSANDVTVLPCRGVDGGPCRKP